MPDEPRSPTAERDERPRYICPIHYGSILHRPGPCSCGAERIRYVPADSPRPEYLPERAVCGSCGHVDDPRVTTCRQCGGQTQVLPEQDSPRPEERELREALEPFVRGLDHRDCEDLDDEVAPYVTRLEAERARSALSDHGSEDG